MAVPAADFYPYSKRLDGTGIARVTDTEHEALWSLMAEGVLPGQAANALEATISAGSWTVQPATILLRGHVIVISTSTETLPAPPATQTQQHLLVSYLDQNPDPWEAGIRVISGVPGGTRPGLNATPGRYEFAIRSFSVAPGGTIVVGGDERPYVGSAGQIKPRPKQADNGANISWSSETWSNGIGAGQLCELTFQAPASGRVWVHTYASIQAISGAAGIVAFTLREDHAGGSVVRGPFQNDGPVHRGETTSGTVTVLVENLQPYRSYYIRVAHKSDAGGVLFTLFHRRIAVQAAD